MEKFTYTAPENGYPEWNNNPEIVQVNRMEPHTDVVPFNSLKAAEGRKEESPYYRSLNGVWKFKLYDRPADVSREYIRPDFPMETWEDIRVPGHWQLQGWDYPQYTNIRYPWEKTDAIAPPMAPVNYNPVGCYLTGFEVPASWEGNPVFISFQGVESAFYVWVNGELAGYSQDSFTPAEFDITPYMKKGENRLALEVYRWCDGSWLEDQDFWRLSGIFREVYLYTAPGIHISDYVTVTRFDRACQNALLDVKVQLVNYWLENGDKMLILSLYDVDGKQMARVKEPVSFSENAQTERSVSIFVDHPAKWSAESPNLYTLFLELYSEDGAASEVLKTRVGFRVFEIEDGLMKLNGKRIVLQGMNRHEFNCETGRVITEEEMVEDIRMLKQNNINAVRTCHYPDHQRWYELCDEYGMYVMDETNLETHGTWTGEQTQEEWFNAPGSKPWWTPACIDRANSMLKRDRNHPSVLIWSLGNESYGGNNFIKMHDFLRKEDPTRPIHYEGVFELRSSEAASDMESQMYTSPQNIKKFALDHPEKPVILCEYSHGTGNSGGNLRKYTDLFEQIPRIQGGFIWDWKDKALLARRENGDYYFAYGGDFGDLPNSANEGCNGMLFADGTPQPQLYEVKRCYENIRFTLTDPDRGIITVRNSWLFQDLTGFELFWQVEVNGRKQQEGNIPLSAEAGAEETIHIPFAIPDTAPRDLVLLTLSAKLKEDTMWAVKGHECAFAQFKLPPSCGYFRTAADAQGKSSAEEDGKLLRISCGKVRAEFDRLTGEMLTYSCGQGNLLKTSPKPYFWRAPTDNDRRSGYLKRCGIWKEAGDRRTLTEFCWHESAEGVKVVTGYRIPTVPFSECSIIYLLDGFGRVKVEMELIPGKGLPEIPAVGMFFTMQKEYDRFSWFGNGPWESYWDRKEGVRMGIYSGTVQEQYVPYILPQECGNKTEVRSARIMNRTEGIKLTGMPEMELSVLPYEPAQIEGKGHTWELPVPDRTVVRVNLHQMGLGGDRCWGDTAVAHPEFLLHTNQNYHFSFMLEGVTEGS